LLELTIDRRLLSTPVIVDALTQDSNGLVMAHLFECKSIADLPISRIDVAAVAWNTNIR
jgi:hypothetical protein